MRAYWKDIFREIKNTMGRFISLLIIAALGSMAIVGIQATSIDMRAVADKTYKMQNLYDIQLKSSTGFETEDIESLRNSKNVHNVMPTYIYDVYIYSENESHTARTYALPGELNKIELLDGRLPQNDKECAVDGKLLRYGGYKIGDSITLGLDSMDDYHDIFDNNELIVVGVISSPFYVSLERGRTSLGDGSLNFYLYLCPETYKLDVYTDVYILMDGSQDMDNLTDEYNNSAEEWKNQINLTGDIRVQAKKDEFSDAQKEIDDGWIEYYDGVKELNEKITDGKKELDDAKIKLDDAKKELEEAQKTLDKKIADSLTEIKNQIEEMAILYGLTEEQKNAQINEANKPLESERIKAQKEIDDGWTEYQDGLDEYNDGVKTLETEEADALKELAEAETELKDAQKKLNDAPNPEWFYFTRKDGVAYDSYYQDTWRLQKIGYVFPLIFFLVALLVSLTTMSRMVEEHRTQIGIYKALGYNSFKIMMKYLIYAFLAGGIGGLLGVVAGSSIFPLILSDAYGHLYEMPPVSTPIPIGISSIAIASSVGIVMLVTLITCISSMSDTPANLMRPKSPLAGKRVLIERITFIWNRLNFSAKVTARNIFRYKKRFIMTLIGVAGCSALLLTAFGLRDSVGGVGNLQYEKIVTYDVRAYTKEIKTEEQRESLDALLSGEYLYIREESADAKNKGSGFFASLIIPETPERLNDFINLHTRKSGNPVQLISDGVVITEKLARVMGVSVGGSFEMTTSDGRKYSIKITGISENYVDHYIFMPPKLYSELFGSTPLYNSILVNPAGNISELAEQLLTDSNIRAVIDMSYVKANINDSTDALKIVTVVLIILACALAFVVLFNLTNINITERIRELATIKVLGFYDAELAMYIYRENAIVTAMGIAAGLIGGIWLHGFVLTAAEIDLLMFPHIVNPLSYLYSVALSIVFAVFVNLVMSRKLMKIDMVESLKNVE